jgi:hypothetical protein
MGGIPPGYRRASLLGHSSPADSLLEQGISAEVNSTLADSAVKESEGAADSTGAMGHEK